MEKRFNQNRQISDKHYMIRRGITNFGIPTYIVLFPFLWYKITGQTWNMLISPGFWIAFVFGFVFASLAGALYGISMWYLLKR